MHRVSSRCYNRLLHTNIVPNVIQSHWMSGCGMLQAPVQNAMQFKYVQMSLDDSQTSQQTLVQWRQCQCCIVCPWVHAEEQPGDWVADDSLSCCKYVFRRRIDEKLHSTIKLRGTSTLLVPIPKVRGTCLPRSPWLLRLWRDLYFLTSLTMPGHKVAIFMEFITCGKWCERSSLLR